MTWFGVDVSAWQQGVDWPTVLVDPTRQAFAATKASEGLAYRASTLDGDRQAMADGGLTARLLYHFSHPGLHAPEAEAAYFLGVLGGVEPGEVPVLDHEVESVDPVWAHRFLSIVSDAIGRPAWLYESYAFANSAPSFLGSFPLWVAGYGRNDGRIPTWADGVEPHPQQFEVGPWGKDWPLWQYTSQANVAGVPGLCDDNVSYLSLSDLATLSGADQPPPIEEDDMTPAAESALLFLGAFFQDVKMNKYAAAGDGDWRAGMIAEGELIAQQHSALKDK